MSMSPAAWLRQYGTLAVPLLEADGPRDVRLTLVADEGKTLLVRSEEAGEHRIPSDISRERLQLALYALAVSRGRP